MYLLQICIVKMSSEPNRVYYRVLMAVFIFKDYHGFITSNQRERATVGLFSSVDKCDEKVLEVVAKGINFIFRNFYFLLLEIL